jgi:hypothetical protein
MFSSHVAKDIYLFIYLLDIDAYVCSPVVRTSFKKIYDVNMTTNDHLYNICKFDARTCI